MNKAALVDRIAYEADIPPSDAKRALEAIVQAIQTELSNGGEVCLLGFGKFVVSECNRRYAWSSKAGVISASPFNRVRFSPGKHFRDTLNKPSPRARKISTFVF